MVATVVVMVRIIFMSIWWGSTMGTNQDNQAGVNEGHGKVIITYIGN